MHTAQVVPHTGSSGRPRSTAVPPWGGGVSVPHSLADEVWAGLPHSSSELPQLDLGSNNVAQQHTLGLPDGVLQRHAAATAASRVSMQEATQPTTHCHTLPPPSGSLHTLQRMVGKMQWASRVYGGDFYIHGCLGGLSTVPPPNPPTHPPTPTCSSCVRSTSPSPVLCLKVVQDRYW